MLLLICRADEEDSSLSALPGKLHVCAVSVCELCNLRCRRSLSLQSCIHPVAAYRLPLSVSCDFL